MLSSKLMRVTTAPFFHMTPFGVFLEPVSFCLSFGQVIV